MSLKKASLQVQPRFTNLSLLALVQVEATAGKGEHGIRPKCYVRRVHAFLRQLDKPFAAVNDDDNVTNCS